MSFRDWYHPDRSSPDGRSGAEAGLTAGVQIGSMFGAPGAAIGGAIGTILGGFGSSSGARRRARRRATRQSYEFAGDLFSYREETQRQITEGFDYDVSYLTARTGASGARVEDSAAMGQLIENRDQQLSDLNTEVAEFRQGESYEWFMKDYERVTGVVRTGFNFGGKDADESERGGRYSIGQEGRTGNIAYTAEQQRAMRTLQVQGDSWMGTGPATAQLYGQYADRIRPSVDWYERRVFGDESDRAAYDEYINQRIESANTWYDRQMAMHNQRVETQRRRQEIDDSMRGSR